ncbi:MAG TPA: DoxX family protein [Kofleriaceae bacterium]|nr:DoxX family protein [Kofleriaceae bacterium]
MSERFAFGRDEHGRDAFDGEVRHAVRPTTALIGRLLMSSIFLVSGFHKLVDPSGTIAAMSSQGVPAPGVLLWIAAFAELAGGVALLTGFLTRLGALGLFLYLIPTTLVFHRFWDASGPMAMLQQANFLKNLTIMGGLLMLVAHGPGRYSLDHKLHTTIHHHGPVGRRAPQ